MKKYGNKYDLSSRKRRKKTSKIVVYSCFVAAFIGVFFVLFRLPFFQIKNIDVRGGDNLPESEIKETAENILRGSYFYMVPKSNILFYPKQGIRSAILSSFPEISEALPNVSLREGLLIEVSGRKTKALWCGEECLPIDETGFIYEKKSEQDLNSYLRIYGLISGDPIGQTFGSQGLFQFLDRFNLTLSSLGLEAREIRVTDRDKAEAIREDGSMVIFTPDPGKESELVENLTLFVDDIKSKNQGAVPVFQYIDARYGNKIFYKLK